MSEQERIYQAYGNAIFNMQNWLHAIERGKLTREEEIEHLNEAIDLFRKAHQQFKTLITNEKA